jgi:hypothetical protein
MSLEGGAGAFLAVAAFVVLSARLLAYVREYSVDILFWDQWDFLEGLFAETDGWTLFRWQHGPHRQGLGGLVLRAVYALTRWSVRAEVMASASIVIAAAGLALITLWRLTRTPSWTDATVPLLCLTPAMGEIFVGASNPAHGPLPMLLVFGLACAWTLHSPIARALCVSLLGFLGTFTGFGFFVGLVNPVLFAAELIHAPEGRTRTSAAFGLGASVLTLVTFFWGWKFFTAAPCFQFPHPRPYEYLTYSGLILGHPLGMNRLGGVRSLLAPTLAVGSLVLAGWALWRLFKYDSPVERVITLLIGFTTIFAFNTAVGRVCFGVETAATSRYVPYAVPGWIGVLVIARLWVRAPERWMLVATLLVFAATRAFQTRADDRMGREFAEGKRRWAECYRARGDIAGCDSATGFRIYPDPSATGLKAKLDFLEARHLNLFREE